MNATKSDFRQSGEEVAGAFVLNTWAAVRLCALLESKIGDERSIKTACATTSIWAIRRSSS